MTGAAVPLGPAFLEAADDAAVVWPAAEALLLVDTRDVVVAAPPVVLAVAAVPVGEAEFVAGLVLLLVV